MQIRRAVRRPLVITVGARLGIPLVAANFTIEHIEQLQAMHTHVVYERGFRGRSVRKKLSTFEVRQGRLYLPRGSLRDVEKFFARRNVPYTIEDATLDHGVDAKIIPSATEQKVELRDYQRECSDLIVGDLQNPRPTTLVIRAPTGSGKTLLTIDAIIRLQRRTIIVVWTAVLLNQWRQRLARRLGWPISRIGQIGDGKMEVADITVAMQQTLARSPERLEEIADRFDVFVGDEIQRWGAESFRTIAGYFPARWRIGISADERRKDRREFLIHENFGPPAIEIDTTELVADGSISPLEVIVVPTEHREPILEQAAPEERPEIMKRAWSTILDNIAKDEERTKLIVSILIEQTRRRRYTLAFADRVELCQQIARLAAMGGTPCGTFLGGAKNKADFQDTLRRLDNGELISAAGTSCVYAGLDVPRLEVGIVATPTHSNKQQLNQQAGRLRRPFFGKTTATLFYIWDRHLFPRAPEQIRRVFGATNVSVLGEDA